MSDNPQYTAEITHDLLRGRVVVYIGYRFGDRGKRTWFYLMPDEGESIQSVASKILPAIQLHREKNARVAA